MMTNTDIQTVLDALTEASLHLMPDGHKHQGRALNILLAALAEPEGEPSTVLRLIDTIKYLVGIAERGEGRKARDDELPEQFVLGYVKRLEAALAEPQVEPVTWEPFQSLKIKDKPFLSAQPQHETTSQCWCNPEVDYVDPDTGATVYVHKEIQ